MHIQHETHISTGSYAISLAHSLVAYAHTSEDFASVLYNLTHAIEVPETSNHHIDIVDTHGLTPHDINQAIRRTQWLLNTCTEKRMEHANVALTIFEQWARVREREQPKAFVLGLDLGVWPVGIWGQIRRKREPMSIILRVDVPTETAQMVQSITRLTHRVVEKGLIMANGHTGNLEPELGDWLFGDKYLALFRASPQELFEMEAHLLSIDAPHATDADQQGTTMLAITPAIYLSDIPHGETLLALE